MKILMEKNVPLKIIENQGKSCVILNFKKPVGKKMVELIDKLFNQMEKDVSED